MAEHDPGKHLHLDAETGALVARVAKRLGTTEEQAIQRGLRDFESRLNLQGDRLSAREKMERYWRENPLPPRTGPEADKAFFDRLWGEE
jgi:antitoxin VapB